MSARGVHTFAQHGARSALHERLLQAAPKQAPVCVSVCVLSLCDVSH